MGDGSVKFVKDSIAMQTWWNIGTRGGGNALGRSSWPDIAVDVGHPQLVGVEDWRGALVAGCSADVLVT